MAGPAEHLIPTISKVEHFANRVTDVSLLGDYDHLVSALRILYSRETKGSIVFASNDHCLACFGAESNFWEEGIDSMFLSFV